ncbi:MAG: glycosyltransferase [Siphonobacter aquaeclarae]|nr:glycosyltransferase [Siphonobacter aquaeclarae]
MEFFAPDAIQKFVTTARFDEATLLRKDLSFPKISVITPSYNQAEFLERTLLSILNQNYPNLELIVMDGGSTDGSADVIRKYEKYITYWVSEKDGGQTAAINAGFRKATGDWVTFQNSDDVFAPNALLTVGKAIRSFPDVSVFYGNLLMIDENDLVFEHKKQIPFWPAAQVYEGMQVFNQCMVFRRELLTRHGYLDEGFQFAFDYEICTRWSVLPEIRFRLLNDFWACFRQHQAAKSSTINHIGMEEHARIKATYATQLKSTLPEKLLFPYIRFRKLAYFLGKLDFSYFFYRLRFNRQ